MIRRPPRSTRTDTLFPYTTLFRSGVFQKHAPIPMICHVVFPAYGGRAPGGARHRVFYRILVDGFVVGVGVGLFYQVAHGHIEVRVFGRSEERRVGKECVSTCRSRWWPAHLKTNTTYRHSATEKR